MKRILMALAVLLTIQMADAQVKSTASAKKAVEAAELAAENPKKATKTATWLKLASTYIDAYNAPMGNGWVGANKQELTLLMGTEKPVSSQNVTLSGEPYTKDVYGTMNYYFNRNGQLSIIEVTQPIYPDALEKALEAYKKAAEVDVKGAKSKDIDEGIKNIASKYYQEAINEYTFGDFAAASEKFEKALIASESTIAPNLDTMALTNAATMALMVKDFDRAEPLLKKSIEVGYLDEGEVYARLATIYSGTERKEEAKKTLEEGFSKYPQNQSIIIGLINYYIENNEDPEQLFSLLDVAKKNEPGNASLYYVEGDIHKKLGNIDKAIASYDEAIKVNKDYEYGYIGKGQIYYDEAVKIAEQAATEFDDAKYAALVEQYDATMINAIEPFEQAFNISQNESLKVAVADILKNIYYRFRDKDAKYMEGYNKYSSYVSNNSAQ